MTETTMPATEAEHMTDADERVSYELAFHVLPTVAEGEVAAVVTAIKDIITQAGGELSLEEAPQRFELAYEITKRIDGKNRHYNSAYFGWIRFLATGEAVTAIAASVEAEVNVLRSLVVKLSKAEETHPFYFHEALGSDTVTTIDVAAETPAPAPVAETEEAADTAPEETPADAAAAPEAAEATARTDEETTEEKTT